MFILVRVQSGPLINILALVGFSPAVVTETLYVLLREGARVKTVHLVATSAAEAAVACLTAPGVGQIAALWATHGRGQPLPEIRMHTIAAADGPIADIRSARDHDVMADSISRLVAALTDEAEPPLHASIAGGRKTMGAALMIAMCLHGRSQDAVSHCLVSVELEADREFYFPASGDLWAEAHVSLVNLSFPRLRHLLRPEVRTLPMSRLVASLTSRLGHADGMRLVLADGWLHTPGGSVRLGPRHCAVLAVLAEAAPAHSAGVTFRDLRLDRLVELYVAAGAAPRQARELGRRLMAEDPAPWFLEQLSQMRRKFRDRFGIAAGHLLAPEAIGRRPRTRYRLGPGMAKLRVEASEA